MQIRKLRHKEVSNCSQYTQQVLEPRPEPGKSVSREYTRYTAHYHFSGWCAQKTSNGTSVLSWMKYWWSCAARQRVRPRKWLSSSTQVHTVFLVFLTIGHLFVVYTHTTNLWPPSPQVVWLFWRLPCHLLLLLFRRRLRNVIWESPSCLFLSNI